MARPGAAYPQVEPGVRALMAPVLVAVPATWTAARALERCRRAGARGVVLGARRVALEPDLARAVAWDLGARPAAEVAWAGVPVVDAAAPEIAARRLMIAGAALVLVRAGREPVGVIERARAGVAVPALSIAGALDRPVAGEGEARLWLLRLAGKLGEGLGVPVFAVGGLVRDLLLQRRGLDVDLAVEGDGPALARRLSEEIGGRLTVHPEFGTASIEDAVAPGSVRLGRIDVASARAERYDAPGVLPAVRPASLAEDLGRRDFSVNAMAVVLSPSGFGRLLDPFGGRRDLRARRLRPLGPLSFVEDPTRMFRAARYCARLGFRLAAEGRAGVRLALAAPEYPALSGQRLRAEIDLLTAEPTARQGLELVLRWGLPTLWSRAYHGSPKTRARLRALGQFRARATAAAGIDAGEMALVALLMDQPGRAARESLDRLAVRGEPAARILAAIAAGDLARRLGCPGLRPSEVADALRPLPPAVLAGAWLRGRGRARRRIEWFLGEGSGVRPLLSGEDVVRLGVPRGPRVGECLAALRRLRLDGRLTSDEEERACVRGWIQAPGGAAEAGPATTNPDRKEA